MKIRRFIHRFDKPIWVLLYMHDWDDDGGVYPEIHAWYNTEAEAVANQLAMSNPDKYWVRKTHKIVVKEK